MDKTNFNKSPRDIDDLYNQSKIYADKNRESSKNSDQTAIRQARQNQLTLPKTTSYNKTSIDQRMTNQRGQQPQKTLEDYIKKCTDLRKDEIIACSNQHSAIENKFELNIAYFNGLQLLQDHFGNTIPKCYKTTHEKLAKNNYISYLEFLNLSEMIGEYKTNIALRKRHKTE